MRHSGFGLSTIVGLSSALSSVAAHQGCGGQEIARRNLGMDVGATGYQNIQRRYVGNGTTGKLALCPAYWFSPSRLDANAECSYYTYQPVVDAKSQFPTTWNIAGLVAGDTEAQTLFNQVNAQVNATVPNIQVKGTPNGDFCKFDSRTPLRVLIRSFDSGVYADLPRH
jgi:hypothetical protein